MANKEFLLLLQSVVLHWEHSAKAYREYMENGKKFRYAEILKLHNTAVKSLLTDNIAVIPGHFVKEVEVLIEHYTIWSAKWDDLSAKLNPVADDEFVFENDHRFPRAASQKLQAALNGLA